MEYVNLNEINQNLQPVKSAEVEATVKPSAPIDVIVNANLLAPEHFAQLQEDLRRREFSAVECIGGLKIARSQFKTFGAAERDLTVIVQGRQFEVNKTLFSYLSPYLEAMLKVSISDENGTLTLEGVNQRTFGLLSNYLHGADINTPTKPDDIEAVVDLATLAVQLKMPEVLDACDKALTSLFNNRLRAMGATVLESVKRWISKFRDQKTDFSPLFLNLKPVLDLLQTRPNIVKQIMLLPLHETHKKLSALLPEHMNMEEDQRNLVDKIYAKKTIFDDPDLQKRVQNNQPNSQIEKRLKLFKQLVLNPPLDLSDTLGANLLAFFVYLASNGQAPQLLEQVTVLLRDKFLEGKLSREDAEWVRRIGSHRALT